MNQILALVGLLSVLAASVHLARLVARDGYGTNPAPRSHREELGGRVAQELGRGPGR